MKRSKKTSLVVIALAFVACLVWLVLRPDVEWPPAPLTVRGSFGGLPHDRP